MKPGPVIPVGHSFWDTTLLSRPKDTYELGVRIWTFWQSWYYDSVFSIISGVPCVRDKSTPTTVFPRHSSAYESSIALFLHHYSFKELFSSDRPELIKPKDENIPGVSHPLAAYLKGIAILEHTDKLFLILQPGSGLPRATCADLHRLHAALKILASEHLPIRKEELLETHDLSPERARQLYCALSERIVGHVLLHTATIQLCRVAKSSPCPVEDPDWVSPAYVDDVEYNAARDAVTALRVFGEEVRKLEKRMNGGSVPRPISSGLVEEVQEHPCLLLGFLLTTVCLVLLDRINAFGSNPSSSEAIEIQELEADIKLAMATMEHTAKSFPLLNIQVQKIHEYRAANGRGLRPRDRSPAWEYERRFW